MKPDFKAMSRKELKAYVLAHRDNEEAISAYIEKAEAEGNWVTMPPLKSMEDLDNYPEFLDIIRRNEEEVSQGVSIMLNNNEKQEERVFESEAFEITSNTQRYNEPYGGVFPSKSRVKLGLFNETGYQIVPEGGNEPVATFIEFSDKESNLAQAEEWLSENKYYPVKPD